MDRNAEVKPLGELRVLVTAGSTWTKIDEVRVITNVFTGNTGIGIAKHFVAKGIATTLLYNPRINHVDPHPGLKIVDYVTYEDLYARMQEEICSGSYDVVIHSAAVSDYGAQVKQLVEVDTPEIQSLVKAGYRVFQEVTNVPGKIKSDLPELTLTMTKTDKIVDFVKAWCPGICLVKFKLEVDRTYSSLVEVAQHSQKTSKADLIVANDLHGQKNGIPPALILEGENLEEIGNREFLPSRLFDRVMDLLGKRPNA